MQAILDSQRITEHNRDFGYAGEMAVGEVWQILESAADAILVDVRTPQEWQQVGVPELSSLQKETVLITWQTAAGENAGPLFVEQFLRHPISKESPVLLLCRGGSRSRAAALALTKAGYTCCINITGGFEGKNGWKDNNLPAKINR